MCNCEELDHENRLYNLEGNLIMLRNAIKEFLDRFGVLIYKMYEEIKKMEGVYI